MAYVYKTQGTCYIRLGRGGEKRIHDKIDGFTIGKAIEIQKGRKVAVLSTGAIFDEVKEALDELANENIIPTVYTFPTVKPIDREVIEELALTHETIITVEEHNLSGGFGSAVAEIMAESLGKARLKRIALQDKYSSIVGSQKYLRREYGIDSAKIIKTVKESW